MKSYEAHLAVLTTCSSPAAPKSVAQCLYPKMRALFQHRRDGSKGEKHLRTLSETFMPLHIHHTFHLCCIKARAGVPAHILYHGPACLVQQCLHKEASTSSVLSLLCHLAQLLSERRSWLIFATVLSQGNICFQCAVSSLSP